jgi:diguanylate cyclase (GGDEF)-like protein
MASAAWLAGQLAWDVYGVIGFPQSPSVADAGWWAFAVLAMMSVLRMADKPRYGRPAAIVEKVPLIAAAIALTTAELWRTAAASSLELGPKLSALAYPAVYVAATVLTLDAMVGGALRRLNTKALRLMLIGLAAESLSFILWSTQLLERIYAPGHSLLDPLWVGGMAAFGVGGLLAARSPEDVAPADEPTYRNGVLPGALLMVLLLALIQARLTGAPQGVELSLRVGVLFCAGALVARSLLLGRGLRSLLERERKALSSLAEREAELAHLNQQLISDSRRDPLTGVNNRRALAEDLPVLEAIHAELGESFAFALCDADHFKPYNDRLGHLAGDQALRMIAATARAVLRPGDDVYRFGGEELLLVLRNVKSPEAIAVAERVRCAVEKAAFLHPDGLTGVLTISIGVATGNGESGVLLARADAALYEAKRLGRNRVVAAAEGATRPSISRGRGRGYEEPVPRHLRGMLAVSRAAAAGGGPMPVLEALAEAVRTELSFQVVVVNLMDERREELNVVIVTGDQEARDTLLGTSTKWSEWQTLLESGEEICGAVWLPAGSYEWVSDAAVWTPPAVAAPAPDGWHPEDMLLLPMRGASGDVLGVLSVDQPLFGRRPTETELGVLMAVADHAGLALEQVQRDGESARGESPELRLAAMMLLAETLDMRDPSTAQHSRTVGRYARATALALGLAPHRVERIHAAGVLHDLGKLGISDGILHKPGPLTKAEWKEMWRHPEVGAQILDHAGMPDIASWVRAHHERIDGYGYPAGLSGASISLEARILAVVDAYEAMVAERSYCAAMSPAEARAELLGCSGTQFDPVVVDAFLRALEEESELERQPLLDQVRAA